MGEQEMTFLNYFIGCDIFQQAPCDIACEVIKPFLISFLLRSVNTYIT